MDAKELAEQRERMVAEQILARGVSDERVLDAMRRVPRECFVAGDLRDVAYRDGPLPIGAGQTISQPFIVAYMLAKLELLPTHRALEVGTGSGYAAAVLSHLCAEVYTIERHGRLVRLAKKNLFAAGYPDIKVLGGDGSLGWPPHAPYHAIVVSAASPSIPKALVDQLVVGGHLVIPVGERSARQHLLRVTKLSESESAQIDLGEVAFVPLIGKQAWQNTVTPRA